MLIMKWTPTPAHTKHSTLLVSIIRNAKRTYSLCLFQNFFPFMYIILRRAYKVACNLCNKFLFSCSNLKITLALFCCDMCDWVTVCQLYRLRKAVRITHAQRLLMTRLHWIGCWRRTSQFDIFGVLGQILIYLHCSPNRLWMNSLRKKEKKRKKRLRPRSQRHCAPSDTFVNFSGQFTV